MRDLVRVRKWSTPAQRSETLAEFRSSGLTQREFADKAGISVSALCNWLRQERNRAFKEELSFVEIPALGAPTSHAYKVQLPGGAALEVPQGFASAEVRELLGLIREL
jgi:transcriptional regulator with XRE-family HTH domain